jgi:hypothetical protein
MMVLAGSLMMHIVYRTVSFQNVHQVSTGLGKVLTEKITISAKESR